MVTMQGWMFTSSFEKLRHKILNSATILAMSQLGSNCAFDTIGGEVVSTAAFVIEHANMPKYQRQFHYVL